MLPDTPVTEESNRLDEVDFQPLKALNTEGDEVLRRRRLEAAAIRANTESSDKLISTYDSILQDSTISGDEVRRQQTKEATHEILNHNATLAQELFLETPEDAPLIAQTIQEENTQLQIDAERKDAPYQLLTRQYQDPTYIDEPTRRELAVRASIADEVQELLEGQSTWELLGDIALDFVPFKFLTDVVQASDTFNPFEWAPKMQELVDNFHLLSPEEKKERLPLLKAELLDELPAFRAAQVLTALIDPEAASELGVEFGLWAPIEAATVAAGMLQIAAKTRSAYNAVRLPSSSGDKDAAAKINSTIMVDNTGTAVEATGIDKATASTSAAPMKLDIVPEADTSLSGKVQNSLLEFQQLLKGTIKDLEDQERFIAEPTIAESDIPKAVQRIDGLFDEHIQGLREENKIVDMERVEKTVGPRGVTYDFIYMDKDGGVEEIGRFQRAFELDDNGYWTNLPNPTVLSEILFSPKGLTRKTDFQEAVNSAIRLDFIDAAVQTQLSSLLGKAVEPITKLKKGRSERIQRVSEVLTYGDEVKNADGTTGRVFTPGELRAGVNGLPLDDDEITAYYAVRATMDALGDLRNARARASFEERGVKTVFMGGEAKAFGLPLAGPAEARAALNSRNVRTIYDSTSTNSKGVPTNTLNLEELYAEGKRIVSLEEDILDRGQLYRHAIVRAEDLKELPQRVLDIKQGYIPRINPKNAWFVQAIQTTTLDGLPHQTRKAVRGFDNEDEARRFAEEMQEEVSAGNTDFRSDTRIAVNRDQEIEQFRVGESGLGAAQGLIYGPRRKDPLPFGVPGDELESVRLGAFESIALYLENTKNFISRNDWRMAMQDKWERTARKLTGNNQITFQDPQGAMDNQALARAHGQIREWSGFHDKSELAWDDIVQRMYEFALKTTGKRSGFTDRIHSMKHSDAVALTRTITFHSLLGGLNPVQMLVQGSGAAVALSQGMTNIPNHLRRINALKAMDFITDPVAQKSTVRKFAKGFGFKNEVELRKTKELWDKTGLADSVLTNADISAAQQGFGLSAAGWRRAQDTSIAFFRAGELFNRRISFLQALDELGGIDAVAGNAALERQLMTRVSDMLLNLGRANRAFWQKGVLSIPTQFLQIMSKTVETYMGLNGAFSLDQRLKMAAVQWGLYGAAALPFGAAFTRYAAEAAGFTQEDINRPELQGWVAFLNGGASDFILHSLIGADVIVSDRVALLAGLDDMIMDFFENETSMFEKVAGPTGGVAKRYWDKLMMLKPYYGRYFDPNYWEDFNADRAVQAVSDVLGDAVELGTAGFSSANQVHRYIEMKNLNVLLDRRGSAVVAEDFDTRTELAALFGLKPADLQRKYDLQEMNENSESYIDHKVSQLMFGHNKYWIEINRAIENDIPVPEEVSRNHKLFYDTIMATISNINVRQKVVERFRRRIETQREGNDQLSRQQKEFYDNYRSSLADDLNDLNTRLTPTR
jgi:hypothetical protein